MRFTRVNVWKSFFNKMQFVLSNFCEDRYIYVYTYIK